MTKATKSLRAPPGGDTKGCMLDRMFDVAWDWGMNHPGPLGDRVFRWAVRLWVWNELRVGAYGKAWSLQEIT